jgi:hypothetical protein
MAGRGHPRAEHQTAREFLRDLRPILGTHERADAELVVELFERDRFSGEGVGEDDVDRALAAAGRLAGAGAPVGQGSAKPYSSESQTRR